MIAVLLTLLAVFDIKVSPAIDLFYTARARGAGATTVVSGAKLQAAVDEVRRLEAELGGTAEWGIIEGALAGCEKVSDIRRSFGFFPAEYAFGTRTLKLRAASLKLAAALEAAEPEFMARVWPGHQKKIAAQRAVINARLGPTEAAWIGALTGQLDLAPPAPSILTYLVAEAPAPWGFTRLDRGSQPMIVVGVGEVDGTTLAELPMHELVHALDARQGATRGALRTLRLALLPHGIVAGSPESSRVAHALMYVASGEVMRRQVDARHRHFGETYGTYERMPQVVPFLLEWWGRYLDGSIDRQAAIDGFVAQYAESRR